MAQIRDVLVDSNPWWKKQFQIEFKDREIYEKIRKYLSLPQIIALTGLRRVGKTVLMLKIVEDYLGNGFDPTNIIYFSFDEYKEVRIRDFLKEYEAFAEKSLTNGKYLVLLDEIQKLNGWEDQLKRLYDTFGQNIKFIISGSESLFIKHKSKETLAGRLFDFKVETLSFKEFLSFKGVDYKPVGLHEKELSALFNQFIYTLGFPELVNVEDKEVIKKYIKESILEKIFYRDMPKLFKIRDLSVLESLINIFMEQPGQLVEVSELAKELGVSRQTVSNYLTYLEESFLIKKIYNFSRSRRKAERKLKKYYPTLISVDLLFREDDLSKSKVFEWSLINQLKTEFFWRDPYKNEIDAVLANGKITPIEIKYGRIEKSGMLAFMRKFNVKEGFIISLREEEVQKIDDKTVSIEPAFKFLLK
jgi:hypothetical protein